MKIKILLLGVTSPIGYRFFKLNRQFDIYGVCRMWPFEHDNNIFTQNNISIDYVERIIGDLKPDIIVNCIGLGDVDECEKNTTLAKQINYQFVVDLVNVIKKLDIKSIFFSSSLIYDGDNAPYGESSLANPVNYYGLLKLKADQYIQMNLENYILLRPTTVFGIKEKFHRDNPVNFIVNSILHEYELFLVDDVITNILFIDDLINIMYSLINNNIIGEFNIAGVESISRYDLGIKISNLLRSDKCFIKRSNSKMFKTTAKRPLNTTLLTKSIQKSIDFQLTDLDMALKNIISEISDE